jgi:hypothetical protein
MEARPLGQPGADRLRFVSAVVVEDQVHVQFRSDVPFDGVEEVAELAGAMTLPSERVAHRRTGFGLSSGWG